MRLWAALAAAACLADQAPDAPQQMCHGQLAIGGADMPFVKGVGGSPSGAVLTLERDAGLSLVNGCDEASWDPNGFALFELLGKQLTFTVDLSTVGCACNLALYFVSEPGRDPAGAPVERGPDAPDFCDSSPFYCDANKICGVYCPEIDIMEANNHVFASTPHSCDPADAAGHYASCDPVGCGANTKDMPGKVYGPGEEFQINTRLPFDVQTSFAGLGQFESITTRLVQGANTVELDHTGCGAAVQQLTQAVNQGMAMRITYWGHDADTLAWLDEGPCQEETCTGDNTGTAFISNIQVSVLPDTIPSTAPPTASPTEAPATSTSAPATLPPTPPPTPPPTAAPTAAPTAPATTITTTPNPFDCNSAFDNWQIAWSDAKKRFCCEKEQKGCQARAYEMVVEQDCPAGYGDITTEQECDAARQQLGRSAWNGQQLSGSSDRLPYCWVGHVGAVNFNPAGDTGDTWKRSTGVVCRVTDAMAAAVADMPKGQCSISDGSEWSDSYPCSCGDSVCTNGQFCIITSGQCIDSPSAQRSMLGDAGRWLSGHWWVPLALLLAGSLLLLPRLCPAAPCFQGKVPAESASWEGEGSTWRGQGEAARSVVRQPTTQPMGDTTAAYGGSSFMGSYMPQAPAATPGAAAASNWRSSPYGADAGAPPPGFAQWLCGGLGLRPPDAGLAPVAAPRAAFQNGFAQQAPQAHSQSLMPMYRPPARPESYGRPPMYQQPVYHQMAPMQYYNGGGYGGTHVW